MPEQRQKKPFLGGYRNKKSGQEYHHAITQTLSSPRNRKKVDQQSRWVQVTPTWSKYQQTLCEIGIQTTSKPSRHDYEIIPTANYQTAEELVKVQETKIVVIQRAVRRWLQARTVFRTQLKDPNGTSESSRSLSSPSPDRFTMTDENQEPSGELTEYEQMLKDLEKRQLEQDQAKNRNREADFVARSRKAKKVVQEALRMAREAAQHDRETRNAKDLLIKNILYKAGQPKTWPTKSKCGVVKVETPTTMQAHDFVQAFDQLQSEMIAEGQDRLRALNRVSSALESFSQEDEVKQIQKLVDREENLISMGLRAKSLQGLRLRIVSEFSRVIRSPKFNPEISRFADNVPLVYESPIAAKYDGVMLTFCFGCRKHLARSKFPLVLGATRCQGCERLDQKARLRQDLSAYKAIFEDIKHTEESLRAVNSPIFILQESDIRYIVDNFWTCQSILSGDYAIKSLRLVRWNVTKDWSPWNCILLTTKEAEIHQVVGSPYTTYGPLLLDKVRQKHASAKNHFSKQPIMDGYFLKGCLIVSNPTT